MKKTLDGLTVMRGLFAIYVLFFHISIRGGIHSNHWISTMVSNGAVSMSFFFLLSGFVLAYSYEGKVIEYKEFITRRILRLYPAYLLFGLITLPELLTLPGKEIVSGLILFLTSTQAWVYQSTSSWGFSGSWTVSVELFFYMLFPIMLPIIQRNLKLSLFTALALTSLLIPLSESFTIDYSPIRAVYYSTPIYRLPEFIFGVALGIAYKSGFRVNQYQAAIAFVAMLIVLLIEKNYGYMLYNIVTVPAISVLIVYMSNINICKIRIMKPFMYFGTMSYSFYLMQVAMFIYIDNDDYLKQAVNSNTGWAYFTLITVALSILCHEITEGRISSMIKKRYSVSP